MATSFPYLAFARRNGLDYGDVLRAAEKLKAEPTSAPFGDGRFDQFMARALLAVINAEAQRRDAQR